MPRDMRINVNVNFINLFYQDTVTRYYEYPNRDRYNVTDEEFFSGSFDPKATAAATPGWRYDPRYLESYNFMGRRTIRVQAKLIF